MAFSTKHGMKKHPLYFTWYNIRHRTRNPRCKDYKWYGGRGIGMHDDWFNDAGTFIRDVEAEIGPRPTGMILDRRDNDGCYAPGNLRWSTCRQNNDNRRNTKRVLWKAQLRVLREVVTESNCQHSYETVVKRLNRGKTLDEALHNPVIPRMKRGL